MSDQDDEELKRLRSDYQGLNHEHAVLIDKLKRYKGRLTPEQQRAVENERGWEANFRRAMDAAEAKRQDQRERAQRRQERERARKEKAEQEWAKLTPEKRAARLAAVEAKAKAEEAEREASSSSLRREQILDGLEYGLARSKSALKYGETLDLPETPEQIAALKPEQRARYSALRANALRLLACLDAIDSWKPEE